ncbi:hypothetical protein C8A00DRAFT_15772 [Chaetomidium leptoderma]|uniref:Uncharacterized protein n=1 Tax=Chaetomidium leptoderma TaxID=669021 RepID=A0AAN6VK07_9PEZI|nr:hypothetical protein C8A00DRAFT_15772 [Chaetomidium leptoderma]
MIIYAHADPEPLKPLLALTASSLASLTSLKIILNQVSCHRHEQYGADPLCCLDGREANWSGVYHCHSHYDTHLLPRELRLRILEYTDLIVPSRDVAWSRQDQGYLTFHSESEFAHDYEYRRQFFGCWFPSNTQTPQGPRPYTGCFCRRRHSAFSSFTCKCWAPPGPALFLVCRTLYQDAVLTFYSGNRFIVYDYRADPPWGLPLMDENPRGPVPVYDYPNERLAASQFLREVVPAHCLGHLRFLELVFPPYRPRSWPRLESAATQDWRATVDWLQDKINAPGLTLRVVGGDVSDWTPDSYSDPITVSEGHTIKEAYMNRLRPLRQLGLTRFYAHLPDPWQRREPQNEDISQELIEDGKRRMKSMAERFVMGDQYESLYANNKEEPGLSLWELFHYHDT